MSPRVARYADTPGGDPRIGVTSRRDLVGDLRNVEVSFDGRRLDAEPRRPGSGAAWVYRLADGRLLSVRPCSVHILGVSIDVRIDGRPVPGSARDPARYGTRTVRMLWGLAACGALVAWAVAVATGRIGAVACFGLAYPVACAVAVRRAARVRPFLPFAVLVFAGAAGCGASALSGAYSAAATCLVAPMCLAAAMLAGDAIANARASGAPPGVIARS